MKYASGREGSGVFLILCAFVFCSIAFAEASTDNEDSLATLYSVPSLIGTPPKAISWSNDGNTIAFLWNDRGYAIPDIWMFSPATGEKRRLTEHSDDASDNRKSGEIIEFQWLNNSRIVYVFNNGLHTVDLEGHSTLNESFDSEIEQLRVSPDGTHMSFVREGDLWVNEVREGKTTARRVLKSDGEDVSVESHKWSNNGNEIAFVLVDISAARELNIHYFAQGQAQVRRVREVLPGYETTKRKVGVVRIADASTTIFDRSDEHDPVWGYGWAADDRSLFVDSSNFLATERAVSVYDTGTAKRTVYYKSSSQRPNWVPKWSVAWAPNDKGLIVLSDHEDGFYHLYSLAQAGGVPVLLTKGNWEVDSFKVGHRNSQIYFVANRNHVADRQLYRVPLLADGKVERISGAPGTYEPFYAADFSHVAFLFSDDQTPPDLYLQKLDESKSTTRVTRSPQDRFYEFEWPEVRYVEFSSHVDGIPLVGRLSLPEAFVPTKRYPLIVGPVYIDTIRNQWGGRAEHPNWGLDQFLVSQGYLVFNVNVRGSWGHGKAIRDTHKEFGSLDIDDIESGVRYLVSEGYVDPERMGVWGSSYGGLMTTMSLFKKPGLYAVGIAGAPATNVWHASPEQMRVMGKPEGDDYPERYERQSAVHYASGLEDPLMIIHGTRDATVEYSETVALIEALIANNKVFELVTLPGGNHYWGNDSVEQTRFAYKKMTEFFNRYLDPTRRTE
ncbi:MAG: prolyl oligopeptidase family serine peptidase [Woeseia sp.]